MNKTALVENYDGDLEVIDSVVVYYNDEIKFWTILFKKDGVTISEAQYEHYKKDAVALAKEFGVRVEVDNRYNRQTKHLKNTGSNKKMLKTKQSKAIKTYKPIVGDLVTYTTKKRNNWGVDVDIQKTGVIHEMKTTDYNGCGYSLFACTEVGQDKHAQVYNKLTKTFDTTGVLHDSNRGGLCECTCTRHDIDNPVTLVIRPENYDSTVVIPQHSSSNYHRNYVAVSNSSITIVKLERTTKTGIQKFHNYFQQK